MTSQRAREMLGTSLVGLLERDKSPSFTWSRIADRMAKTFCREHLIEFCNVYVAGQCECGQEICPSRLQKAIIVCLDNTKRIKPQNAPTSETVQ